MPRVPAFLLLLAIGLACYLPGLWVIPPLDRDEARFAQASRQMLESSDYTSIRFQDEPRSKKPIGVYWLQTGVINALGVEPPYAIGLFRMVSVLGALLAAFQVFYFLRARAGPVEAWAASLALLGSALLVSEAHQAKADAALLAAVVCMQLALFRVYEGDARWRHVGLFWLGLLAGVLIKGPVALLVAGATIGTLCVLDRGTQLARAIRPLHLGALCAVLLALWVVLKGEMSVGFVVRMWQEDILPKLISGQESHGAPPGYHLALLMLLFWPASAWLPRVVRHVWCERRAVLAERWPRFLLAWLVPTWLLLELMPTKLPHYPLPLYPALAMLVAHYAAVAPATRTVRVMGLLACLTPLVLVVFAAGAPIAMHTPWPWGTFVAVPAGVAAAYHAFRATRPRLLLALAVVLYGAVLHGVLPALQPVWVSVQLAAHLKDENPARVAMLGYAEPSAVFLLDRTVQFPTVEEAAAAVCARPSPVDVLVLEARAKLLFEEALPCEPSLTLRGEIRGFNYSRGDWVTLQLLQVGHAR